MLQHLKARIGIAADSTDGGRNGKARHARSRHGDTHAVFHQIGRHQPVDKAHRFAEFTSCHRGGISQRNGLGTARRRRYIRFYDIDHLFPHSHLIHGTNLPFLEISPHPVFII